MKWMALLACVLLALIACQGIGSGPGTTPSAPTSGPSGLEEVRILARGME